MNPLKYYGVDWALFLFIVVHLWLLGNKKRAAFLVGIVACCLGVCLGILIGSMASTIMNVVFAIMHIRAFFKWGSSYSGKPRIAKDTWPDSEERA